VFSIPSQTHGVLLQYLELLTSPDVISAEDYNNKILPSLADLGELYGISAPICMQIIRPKLNEALLVRLPPSVFLLLPLSNLPVPRMLH